MEDCSTRASLLTSTVHISCSKGIIVSALLDSIRLGASVLLKRRRAQIQSALEVCESYLVRDSDVLRDATMLIILRVKTAMVMGQFQPKSVFYAHQQLREIAIPPQSNEWFDLYPFHMSPSSFTWVHEFRIPRRTILTCSLHQYHEEN